MPPDGKLPGFRTYYKDNLESAMLEDTRRFFGPVLQENRSVRDFIDSDYSFLNRGLAGLYDIPFEEVHALVPDLNGVATVRELLEKHRRRGTRGPMYRQ